MMKTFCLFIVVALADFVSTYQLRTLKLAKSVVALDLKDGNENFQEKKGQHIEGLVVREETETNKSHTRQLFATKEHPESSKQLALIPRADKSLVVRKTGEHLGGFMGVAKNYAPKLGNIFASMLGAKYTAAMKDKFAKLAPKELPVPAWWKDFAKKYPISAKLTQRIGFSLTDAVVSAVIVFFFPPAAGILVADAAIELAKALYGLTAGGKTDADAQTARVAFQGLSLILAIGGVDDCLGMGEALAEAMGECAWTAGITLNVVNEFTDNMGALNKPEDEKLAKDRNAKLKEKLGAGQTAKVGNRHRKIIYSENPSEDHFAKEAAEAAKGG